MYTVQELQAADYFIKKFINEKNFPFQNKKLQFVINLDGTLWHGDFVSLKNGTAEQRFIADDGDIDLVCFYNEGSNATSIFKKVKDSYTNHAGQMFINPFRKINELPLLLNTVMKIIKFADIKPEDSPIYPYLLNAKSFDGKLELPFIDLTNEPIKIVSLIEIKD